MILQEVIRSMSEDELSMLLYVTNNIRPPGFNIEVNENILTSYKKDALLWGLSQCRSTIKDEFVAAYDVMVGKLNNISPPATDVTAADLPPAPEQLEFKYD